MEAGGSRSRYGFFLLLLAVQLAALSGRADGACVASTVLTSPAGYFDSDGNVEVPQPPSGQLQTSIPSASIATQSGYTSGTTCSWLIRALEFDSTQGGPLTEIFLHFYSFNLTSSADTIHIYDGPNASGLLLATYTGPSILVPASVTTTSGTPNATMFIQFTTTTTSGTGAGFGAYWQAGGCPYGIETLSRQSGFFTDGSGPLPYATRLTCGWLISSSDTTALISATFTVGTESGFDFVYVYDGPSQSDPLIGRLTGAINMTQIQSTSNQLLVIFSSDKSVSLAGFRVDYTIEPAAFCTGTETFTQPAGYFTDGGSGAYLPDSLCTFVIDPTNNVGFIAIYFEKFDLRDDFLYVYEGNATTPMRTLSGGSIPSPILYSGTSALTLQFVTNSGNQGEGFKAIFNAGACTGLVHLYDRTGTITDGSGGSGTYLPNLECLFLVVADPVTIERIRYTFTYFSSEFRFDTLVVYDGTSSKSAPALISYSGTNQSFSTAESTGPNLLLKFNTDADTSARGWLLTYEVVPFPAPTFSTVYYDSGPSIAFIVLLMITAVVIFVLFVFFCIIGWTNKVMTDTSMPYNLFLLAMLFFCCFGLYPFIGEPTDGLCAWRPWVALLFVTTFMTLTIKLYLMWGYYQVQSKEQKGTILIPSYSWPVLLGSFLALCFFVAIEVIFLVLWTAIDYPKPERYSTNKSNDFHYRCMSEHNTAWLIVQYVYIGILLFIGLIGAVRTYVIPVVWNESKFYALAVVLNLLLTLVVVAVSYVLWDIPEGWLSILGFGYWLAIVIVLLCVFLPKLYTIAMFLVRKTKRKKSIETNDAANIGAGAGDDDLDDL